MRTEELAAHLQHFSVTPRPDCRVWSGPVDRDGYGKVSIDGQSTGAHRAAWEHVNGPIPDDLTIDHLCHVRPCVNVAHMELVTRAENTRRRTRFSRHWTVDGQPLVSSCSKGHALTPENTYVTPSTGSRDCRTCKNARSRASKAARRSLQLADTG